MRIWPKTMCVCAEHCKKPSSDPFPNLSHFQRARAAPEISRYLPRPQARAYAIERFEVGNPPMRQGSGDPRADLEPLNRFTGGDIWPGLWPYLHVLWPFLYVILSDGHDLVELTLRSFDSKTIDWRWGGNLYAATDTSTATRELYAVTRVCH
jgi:hypothetical protein